MDDFEVMKTLHRLRQAALRSVLTTDYPRQEDPHSDASAEHAEEAMALAAQHVVAAINALPEDQRPIGWDGKVETVAVGV